MHKGIFSRLAKQNIRNNKSTYIPYIITCIFCIAMIYMMEFLRDCPTLDQAVRQADEVRMIVFTGEIVVEIFCIIFLIYSNSFLMKRRQKEIGLVFLAVRHDGLGSFTTCGRERGGQVRGLLDYRIRARLDVLGVRHERIPTNTFGPPAGADEHLVFARVDREVMRTGHGIGIVLAQDGFAL